MAAASRRMPLTASASMTRPAAIQGYMPHTAHLVNAGWQQLDDCVVFAGALQRLPRGPVVKGALHLYMLAAMAPCGPGAHMHMHSSADQGANGTAAVCALAVLASRMPCRVQAIPMQHYAVQLCGHCERRLTRQRRRRCRPCHLHTMTTGTTFGCAGQPAAPTNSVAGRPIKSSEVLSGAIATWGLKVSGEPGLRGGEGACAT